MGPQGLYRGRYSPSTLEKWSRWLKRMSKSGHQAYVYFDNDQKSAAPKDASRLTELMAGEAKPAAKCAGRATAHIGTP